MLSSASASSSPVVTPGAPARAQQLEGLGRRAGRPTRIRSIWSRVLISMPRSPKHHGSASVCGTTSSAVEDPLGDLVDLAHAVDLDEEAAVAVDLDQRRGLLGVDLLAAPDDVLGVVGPALDLRRAGAAAATISSSSTVSTTTASSAVPGVARSSRRAPRPGRACAGSRRAGSRGAASGSSMPVADHRVGDLVGDVARRRPCSAWPRCRAAVPWETLARKMSPVEIAGIAEVLGDELGLGALAGPGRAHQHQPHLARGTLRSCAAGAGSRSASPCPARRPP